ncbi:MAG: DNA-binding protein [Cyclobacteriaceae bacterium]
MDLKVICLDEPAFFELFDRVIKHVKETEEVSRKWVGKEEAMKLLGCGSTKLQELRDQRKIRFSTELGKTISYERASIDKYHEMFAVKTIYDE